MRQIVAVTSDGVARWWHAHRVTLALGTQRTRPATARDNSPHARVNPLPYSALAMAPSRPFSSAPSSTLASVALALFCSACSSGPAPAAIAVFPVDALESVTSAGGLHIDVRTAPTQPPPRGNVTVQFLITDGLGAPVNGLAIDVVPWMPAMGHGTSQEPVVTPRAQGEYLITNLNLFMPGQWELRTNIVGSNAPAPDRAVPTLQIM